MAEAIFEAVTTERPGCASWWGPTRRAFAAGRARISDEEWVAMGGGLDDAEYNARFKRYFGIELIWAVARENLSRCRKGSSSLAARDIRPSPSG